VVAGNAFFTDGNGMTHRNSNLERVLDFILNHAKPSELEIIEEALQRRSNHLPKGGIDGLDFQKMAREMTKEFATRFSPSDVHGMTRRLVTNMILEQMPQISAPELEVLLDQWVPDPTKQSRGREGELPGDLVFSMVHQFVSYSLGRMPEAELRELKNSIPDWTERYWELFSHDTKFLIRDLLQGKLELDHFYAAVKNQLGI